MMDDSFNHLLSMESMELILRFNGNGIYFNGYIVPVENFDIVSFYSAIRLFYIL